jgi:hypothetical protein
MEIHAPHQPILTLKEALVHLCIVTVGILIALSLEGALTWREHRTLVRETRARLHDEIVGNQKSIQNVLTSLDPAKKKFGHAIDVMSDLSASGNASEAATVFADGTTNVASGLSFAFFNTAGYSTAEVTGALGLMDYSEVLRYADTYDLQVLYARMQDTAERDVVAAAMLGRSMLGKPTPTELEDTRRQLRLALGGLVIMENIATRLDELYSKALKEAP